MEDVWIKDSTLNMLHYQHSSLVNYLAQVIQAKNCLTTYYWLYCIIQLVWVPMTTTQNIRVCFRTLYKTLFPFKFSLSKGGTLMKKVLYRRSRNTP